MTTPQQDYEAYKRNMKKAHKAQKKAQAGQQEAQGEQGEAAEDHIVDAAAVRIPYPAVQSWSALLALA